MEIHLYERAEANTQDASLIDTVDWSVVPQLGSKLTFRHAHSRETRYEVISVEHIYEVRLVPSETTSTIGTYQSVPAEIIVILMDLDKFERGG